MVARGSDSSKRRLAADSIFNEKAKVGTRLPGVPVRRPAEVTGHPPFLLVLSAAVLVLSETVLVTEGPRNHLTRNRASDRESGI
jgi:hypothetical protein